MRTFIVGKARVIATGGDCIKLTPAQYAAAKVMFGIHLSTEELVDLMGQIGEEGQQGKPVKPVQTELAEVVPAVAEPSDPPVNTDSMTWQQIADLGPHCKVRAIMKMRDTTDVKDLRVAKHAVEAYMADRL